MDNTLTNFPPINKENWFETLWIQAGREVGNSAEDTKVTERWLTLIYQKLSVDDFYRGLQDGSISITKVRDFLPIAFSEARDSSFLQIIWDYNDDKTDLFVNVFHDLLLQYGVVDRNDSLLQNLIYTLTPGIAFDFLLGAAILDYEKGFEIVKDSFDFSSQSSLRLFEPSYEQLKGRYLRTILKAIPSPDHQKLILFYIQNKNFDAADTIFGTLKPNSWDKKWDPHASEIIRYTSDPNWADMAIQNSSRSSDSFVALFFNPHLLSQLPLFYKVFLEKITPDSLNQSLGGKKHQQADYQWGLKYLWALIPDDLVLETIIQETLKHLDKNSLQLAPWMLIKQDDNLIEASWLEIDAPLERLQLIQRLLGLEGEYERFYLIPGQIGFFTDYQEKYPWLEKIKHEIELLLEQSDEEVTEEVKNRIIRSRLQTTPYYHQDEETKVFFFTVEN